MACYRLCLAVALCLVITAFAFAQEPLAPPPAGVTLEVLKQDKPATQPAEAQAGADSARPASQLDIAARMREVRAELEKAPKIALSYDGVPFADVLKDLGDRLKIVLVCNDEKTLKRRLWLHANPPEPMAIPLVCGSLLQNPRPSFILCLPEEVKDGAASPGELMETIGAAVRVRVKLEDAKLGDALDYATKVTEVGLAATKALRDKQVSFEASAATVKEMAEGLAKAANCALSAGFVVVPAELGAGLERLEKMSDADLERLLGQGIQEMRPTENMVGQADPQTSFQDGVKTFMDLPAEERKALVERGAALVQRFAALTKRLSPESQAALKRQIQPLLGLAVAGYLSLPSTQRAELEPIIKAFNAFGW